MKLNQLVLIVEGALMATGRPLTIAHMAELFDEFERPDTKKIREALAEIEQRCEDRGFELKEVSSGFRFQVRQQLSPWVVRLWEERPQKYSRALLETLALITYRQPITRGDIENIRGVSVSSSIVKTLLDREWVKVVGHRDVPGRPAMYATTRKFLDYFDLKNLDELPALAEIRDLDTLNEEFGFDVIEDKTIDNESVEQFDSAALEAIPTAEAEVQSSH
jgi:segregation and condensation protein B